MESKTIRGAFWLVLVCGLAGCSGGGDKCAQDGDCPPGRYCRDSTGECVFDCVEDSQCPAGYHCTLHGRCERGCLDGTHDGGDGYCVPLGSCSTGYHDDGLGDCVEMGVCAAGYHDGGDGSCLPAGECASGYVDGGGGVCVLPGTCAVGYHDGGDGVCLQSGNCSDGFHDGGDGTCLSEGSCAEGYHIGGDGECVPQGSCADGFHDGGDGSCVAEGSCAAGYHLGGGDSGICLLEGECFIGFVLGQDGVCIPDPFMFADDFEDGSIDPIWTLWRMEFEESDGCLNSVSQPRIGFDYGHDGHGRGAWLIAHMGNPFWTDYRLTVEVENGPPGMYNPYGVGNCYRGVAIQFRVIQAQESWNEPAETAYAFNMQTADCTDWSTHGKWSLSRRHGVWVDRPSGWTAEDSLGSSKGLASGVDPVTILNGPNLVEIEVVGERIRVWVNQTLLADHTEQPEDYGEGQEPILFGGIGVKWGWESTGKICSVHVEHAYP